MNSNSQDSKPTAAGPDAYYRNIRILWLALFLSPLWFLVLVWFQPVPMNKDKWSLAVALATASLVPFALSFLLKGSLLSKAIDAQNLQQVQGAYIVALALCEAAALLGVANYFVTGFPYFYFALPLAEIGMLLHFPRKQHLLEASYKQF